MPCNSSYMEATGKEVEISRVYCLLDELNGKPINPSGWSGYHSSAYGKTSGLDGDKIVAELCRRLQTVDVTKQSLEMQIWWRNHQEADSKRLKKEIQDIKDKNDRDIAISKLSDHEKQLLGIVE